MPTIHLTLIDTPKGGIALKHDFRPAVGQPCSPAQSMALDLINKAARDCEALPTYELRAADGIDIDAVHRSRDRVINLPDGAVQELRYSSDARQA